MKTFTPRKLASMNREEVLDMFLEQSRHMAADAHKIEGFDQLVAFDEGKNLLVAAEHLDWDYDDMIETLRDADILLQDNTADMKHVENGYFTLLVGGFWEHPLTGQRHQNIETRMTKLGAELIAMKFNRTLNWD